MNTEAQMNTYDIKFQGASPTWAKFEFHAIQAPNVYEAALLVMPRLPKNYMLKEASFATPRQTLHFTQTEFKRLITG